MTFSRFCLLAFASLTLPLGFTWADPLDVGATAPPLQTSDQDGKSLDLAAQFAKGYTLVYFYPKANTPGCTTEACTLRDAFADLKKNGVTVIGVSSDTTNAQKDFQGRYHLPFTLVPDSDHAVAKAFGVPLFFGLTKRQSFLIHNGKIVWRDLSAKPDQQAIEVLAQVNKPA